MQPFAQPGPIDEEPPAYVALVQKEIDDQRVEAASETEALRTRAKRKGDRKAQEAEDAEYSMTGYTVGQRRGAPTKWLWRPGDEPKIGSIPLGEITILAGRGGVGKSTVLTTFAAWITRGTMYGEFHGTPKNVIYIPNEDDVDKTVRPRLLAAGGDPDRMHVPELILPNGRKGKITLPRDLQRLTAFAKEREAACIFFDPLSSNLGVSNRNNGDEMRAVLEEMRLMASSLNLAIVGNAHMRKATSSSSQDGIMGSVELVNVSRSMMAIMADEAREGVIILSHDKSNYSPPAHSYEYQIESTEIVDYGVPIDTSKIQFLGKTDKNVSMMMADAAAGGMETKGAVQEAIEFMTEYLRQEGGRALKQDICNAAQKERISARACQRAAEAMKLQSKASGQGAKRVWMLPEEADG